MKARVTIEALSKSDAAEFVPQALAAKICTCSGFCHRSLLTSLRQLQATQR